MKINRSIKINRSMEINRSIKPHRSIKTHSNTDVLCRSLCIAVLLLLSLFISSSFVSSSQASSDKPPLITNVTSGQFTVSWVTKSPCLGKVKLSKGADPMEDFYDDRGKDFKSATHHVTVKNLKENTPYDFATDSDGLVDDNGGRFYQITTGPSLIPLGSIQPAGKVFLADKITPAEGSMVYVTVSGSEGASAQLSTVVDSNGYWYIELINAREVNYQKLYRVSQKDCRLNISVIGKTGAASLEAPVKDSQGGTKLYDTLVLK